jgi:hypothetical protein
MTVVYEAVPMGEGKGAPLVVKPKRSWHGLLAWAGLLALLLVYTFLLSRYFGGSAIAEPDDNGYFAQGTLLAQTGHTWFLPASDAQYIGPHWLLGPGGKFISRYPPGLAVAIALLDHVGGWRATLLLNPLLSLLALVGIFMAARRIVGPGWGLLAAALLAFNPTFFHHALGGGSHMGVLCVLVWGITLLTLWADTGWWWVALLAGVVLGCIPTIRYADAIMGLGVLLFMAVVLRQRGKEMGAWWVHVLAAGIGAMLPIVPLLIRNQFLFGAFWRTGYSLTNEQTGFSFAYFQQHALDYLWQINSGGLGLLFGLGLAGIVGMMFAAGRRAVGGMLALMTGMMIVVYMAYYWAPQGSSQSTMRFLLPTFGLFVLGATWIVREAVQRAGDGGAIAVATALIAIQWLWGAPELDQLATRIAYQKNSLALITGELEKVAAKGDVVVGMGGGGGGILQQLDFVREWKVADATLASIGGFGGRLNGGFGGADPDAPSPRQAAKTAELRERYVGSIAEIERKFTQDLLAWAGPQGKVWVIGNEGQVMAMDNVGGGKVTLVHRVPLPAAPVLDPAPGNGAGFGGRGGRGGSRGGGRGGRGGLATFTGDGEVVIGQWARK